MRLLATLSAPVPFPNRTLFSTVEVAFHPQRAFSEERIVFEYNFDNIKSQMKFLEEEKNQGPHSRSSSSSAHHVLPYIRKG